MSTAIVMPSINIPPNLPAWSAQLKDDDVIVVAGSEKTPHDGVVALLDKLPQRTVYLHPFDKRLQSWQINKFLPLNDHNRFNLALLEALRFSPDYVLCLDDDNYPADEYWVRKAIDILREPNQTRAVVNATNGWFNPGRVCMPQVVHRGYPHWLREAERGLPEFRLEQPNNERVGVLASLWLGDPDIDATERIVNDPQVREVRNTLLCSLDTWAPFDTQSTLVDAHLAPLLFMWTEVGRFDDIWGSYLCRAYMNANGYHHAFGKPAVRQDRNPHNLVRDLENEVFGYKYNEEVTTFFRHADMLSGLAGLGTTEAFTLMNDAMHDELRFLPTRLLRAFDAWQADLEALEEMK